MTIDEKLQHFYEVSLDEAREDAARAIQDHKDYLRRFWRNINNPESRLQRQKSKQKQNMYEEK